MAERVGSDATSGVVLSTSRSTTCRPVWSEGLGKYEDRCETIRREVRRLADGTTTTVETREESAGAEANMAQGLGALFGSMVRDVLPEASEMLREIRPEAEAMMRELQQHGLVEDDANANPMFRFFFGAGEPKTHERRHNPAPKRTEDAYAAFRNDFEET